ncbi:outer membrane usher protein [Klebsiella quasivariicola]|uniref:outer membrane usher protein n=1 Tax=Klebsiella quasivariicola TaxID=2026240 RepID=UPI003CCB6141
MMRLSQLARLVSILLGSYACQMAWSAEEAIQFNTDVMDVKDRSSIDLSQFSRAGYLMPGEYPLTLRLNKLELAEHIISFIPPDNDPKGSEVCLTPSIVKTLGIKEELKDKLIWWHNNQCLSLESLEGMTATADLGSGILYLNIPQAYLEYTADNWDPPSRWDEGISGLLFDYNLNASNVRQQKGSSQQSISGNGTTGLNLGPWRFRADWQGDYEHTGGPARNTRQNWEWSRFYLYRAVLPLRAKLMLGENYLPSTMFDSFRFTGASLSTDDAQLPPNLRGYAPEVTGIAKTNAKVTISQQGRVLYESSVPAGPFRIQDLSDSVSGKLDVKVQEQDGSVTSWQVDTASIPYLSRPGLVRYKVSAGKPSDYNHKTEGPGFATGEFSWGVSNGWSLYGGGLFAGDYNALSIGIGRDLLILGAISADITHSRAILPNQSEKLGNSYRLSYSKRFDEYDSQVTFAGYRFSEQDFMSMSQYLNARYHAASTSGNGKELYTISVNKQFRDLNVSTYLNYSHQTYWDRPANDTWSGSLATYFDVGHFHNISLGLSATRTQYNGKNDDGIFLNLSLPWGTEGSLDYSGQSGRGGSSHSVGWYDRIDSNNSYRISAGVTEEGNTTGNGYFTHNGDLAQLSVNTSFQDAEYNAIGLSLQGGATATLHGAALHRMNSTGGTRLMVDTAGISDVPVRGYGGITKSNIFGKAVVSDVNSYYRSNVTIDLDELANDVDATRSVIEDTLTEGAIGYRKFGLLAGQKAMAAIRLADNSAPPFGATVTNSDRIQTGIIGDDGHVWLTGLQPGGILMVNWSGVTQCRITLPDPLPTDINTTLLLPCIRNNNVIH